CPKLRPGPPPRQTRPCAPRLPQHIACLLARRRLTPWRALLASQCLTPLVSDTPHGRAITLLPSACRSVSDTSVVRHPPPAIPSRCCPLLAARSLTTLVSDPPHGRPHTLLLYNSRLVSYFYGV